ncbi:Allophanate hydrolase 2 subunit 2 [Salisediminibacterium beveridgei]|uniref:Allophanate hydrolase 2 subunit 2 n=2 Tax=Salisediminibacterium beveridgei TaxID=632773 RepID=A0A1D7QS81_9BACI|nr:Allophanate hydrolase 2 subunit 2 [Salisediminibacterium beveridgei]
MLFHIEEAGVLTTVQDLGRHGYRHLGFPLSGAVDPLAHRYANHIVGNPGSDATLEITMGGLKMEVLEPHLIAVTGADLDATINQNPFPLWKAVKVQQGDQLRFRGPVHGIRSYLAVSGGIEHEMILGSRSVYERAGIGRALKAGDFVFACRPVDKQDLAREGWQLASSYRPFYNNEITLRVIPGRHMERFTLESIARLATQEFTLAGSDRMGAKLHTGSPLKHKKSADILSEPVMPGTVQVAVDGQPMILLADAQTTGGYTSIGTVREEDLWQVAQLKQGGTVYLKMEEGWSDT